ncbi:Biotin synthase-related enzyme [Thermoplasmatales archaeon BRNA1]|nr:Biotin synthase-related enzyme [Thermoplasmatales archaeon BRNA1]
MDSVSDILGFIRAGGTADRSQIETLLNAEGKDKELLYENAREVRDRQFGDRVFAYGFVYFSTYCHNNCTFCYYRRTNQIDRYRKTPDEIVDLAMDLKEEGIDLVDLTMGEDDHMYADNYSELIDIVSRVSSLGINVMVSPGAVKQEAFPKLKEAGADFFAVYQETHNRELYDRLRLQQDFDFRYNQREWAHDAGMLAEDGLLVGVGETISDIADSIIKMGKQGCEQVRAMTFVPQAGTPLQDLTPVGSDRELKAIAVMRMLYPERFIPATLDVEGISGMKDRLDAGASTITSIVVPRRHLAGVAQPEKDIESGGRSVQHVFDLIDQMGKKIATQNEFSHIIADLEAKLARSRHLT